MYCKNCGQEIADNAAVCIHCGVSTSGQASITNNAQFHTVPKCRKCGYVGEFKREKMFRTIDWVIGLATFWFGFGIIYFIVMAIIRHDEKNRETICPQCGEKDSAVDVY